MPSLKRVASATFADVLAATGSQDRTSLSVCASQLGIKPLRYALGHFDRRYNGSPESFENKTPEDWDHSGRPCHNSTGRDSSVGRVPDS